LSARKWSDKHRKRKTIGVFKVRKPSVVLCKAGGFTHEVLVKKVYAITSVGTPPLLFAICPVHLELIRVRVVNRRLQ